MTPSEIEREEQKSRLREWTEQSESLYRNPAYVRKEKEKHLDSLRSRLVVFCLFFTFAAALFLYFNNYTYTTYSVDREMNLGSIPDAGVYAYKDGVLLFGADSVTYVKDTDVVWTQSILLRDPVVAMEGGYFAFYDRDAYQAYICSEEGILSIVKVSRKICGIDISDTGIAAVYTRSSDAAYISFFDRYGNRSFSDTKGNRMSVELKLMVDVTGMPLRIALSPDGTRLLVILYSISNGIGESRLLLYDFENGKESDSYIIARCEDLYDTDTFLIDCNFTDSSHALAVGDNELLFLEIQEKNKVVRKTVPFENNVLSVFFLPGRFGFIEERKDGAGCVIYDGNGSEEASFACPEKYDNIALSDRYLCFTNREDLIYYNLSGRKRYEGTLVEKPDSCAVLPGGSLALTMGNTLQVITLH